MVWIMYLDLHLCMVEKKFKAVEVSSQFLLLNYTNLLSFSLPHLWLFFCVEPPFITIHRQSEGTTSSRQNTPLTVKRRMAGKTHKNSIENWEFCDLVWQAQAPLPPRYFKGHCLAFCVLCLVTSCEVARAGQLEIAGCVSQSLLLSLQRKEGCRPWEERKTGVQHND